MNNIPEEQYVCKYCFWCTHNENDTQKGYCENHIHKISNVNTEVCHSFAYDDTINKA